MLPKLSLYANRDDSSIGKSLAQPVIMLNDHNQPDIILLHIFYLLAEVILELLYEHSFIRWSIRDT